MIFVKKQLIFGISITSIIFVVLTIAIVNTLNTTTTTISNMASIKTIGVSVWEDPNATTPLTFIDWGIIEPSENKTVSCYIRNDANVPSTLSLTTENWDPTNATICINLSWNLDDVILDVNEIVETRFTLSVSSEILNITTFSFDISIIATG